MPHNKEPDSTEERFEGDTQERSWDANVKRTYDEMQSISLTSQQRSQDNYDKLQNVALQALQNAVSAGHQATLDRQRHVDLAVDRQWNVDEQGFTVAKILNDSKFQDAIAASVVKIMADVAIGK